eukprot:CAMPEP_0115888342 /NCGR_PEP_ID=MMETSP0287-20121206/32255_1 /TAXON_ID=412157 /ORGANISM="Chrysochromulina rotalis, Strain UIO044" /LENGTH=129 /DNA_ID=CAMNT_0003345017 /DNA_START=215 /DNA_END=601 /DNA_ORIENTATION=+
MAAERSSGHESMGTHTHNRWLVSVMARAQREHKGLAATPHNMWQRPRGDATQYMTCPAWRRYTHKLPLPHMLREPHWLPSLDLATSVAVASSLAGFRGASDEDPTPPPPPRPLRHTQPELKVAAAAAAA